MDVLRKHTVMIMMIIWPSHTSSGDNQAEAPKTGIFTHGR